MTRLDNYTFSELSAMDDLMTELDDMLDVSTMCYGTAKDFYDLWDRITSEMKYKEEEENEEE